MLRAWPAISSCGSRWPSPVLNPDCTSTGFAANITAIEGNELTLDRALPPGNISFAVLMNRGYHTQNWTLRDNYCHDNLGCVLLYADYGTVTGNRFVNGYYHEGTSFEGFEIAGTCRNFVTHGNFFDLPVKDSSFSGMGWSHSYIPALTYSANSFWGMGLNLNQSSGTLVTGNWFYGRNTPLWIHDCTDTLVQGNLNFQPGQTAFAMQTEKNEKLVCQENRANPARE